jgi:hypothetical protein
MGSDGAAKVRERWDWERVIDRVEAAYVRALAEPAALDAAEAAAG